MKTGKLVAMYRLFNEKHTFAVGDIVEWKHGLKNKRSNGPFVVVHVYDTPLVDKKSEAGSSYFNEPLDIVLGHIDSDGEFLVYHYDSRRFEPA